MRETTLRADPQVSAEGGEEMLQALEQRFPRQPVGKTMVRQAVPLQPREVHGGADLHLQPGDARRRL